ncbi:MAG: hypothetical protein M3065_05010 [Actinomycetota bacterium]|nr:hypothetical protein [Actinomycetota bacterium]
MTAHREPRSALPIAQAAALRRFSERLETLTPDQIAEALFAVMNATAHQHVAIGSVDISSASESARAITAVNELPHAGLTVDVDLLGSTPIDFWNAVTFDIIENGVGQRLFAGAVQDASGRDPMALDCEGAVELIEHNRGSLATAGVDTAELVTTIMRQIGLPENTITLSSPKKRSLTHERFDVFVPVRGLASVNADALDTAEEQGYAEVETTMAWLVARQRYGFLRLPDGAVQTFSRTQALQSVRYGPAALVRGEETRRHWLRWVHDTGRPAVRDLTDESDLMRPAIPENLDLADERALRALMWAVNEPGLQQQVQALSEALESYTAGVEVAELFSRAQRKELRELAPDWLNPNQKAKFENAINGINTTPFGVRLSERLDRDGVPLIWRAVCQGVRHEFLAFAGRGLPGVWSAGVGGGPAAVRDARSD